MRSLSRLLVLVALLSPVAAGAQAFGQWTEARPLALDQRLGGGYLMLSSHSLGAIGQLRLCLHPGVDFGFQGGLQRANDGASRTSLQLGVDAKAQVVGRESGAAADVSLGGCVGIETADNITRLLLGPTAVGSRRFDTTSGPLVASIGASLLFSRLSVGAAEQTDVSLPVRLGADFAPNPGLHFVAELQLRLSDDFGDSTLLSVGMQAPF